MKKHHRSTSFYILTEYEQSDADVEELTEHLLNLVNDPMLSIEVSNKYFEGKRVPLYENDYLAYPDYAYKYALHNIKGRWPEAEPRIFKDFRYAIDYAKNVLKEPLPNPVVKELIHDFMWSHFLDYLKSGLITERLDTDLEVELNKSEHSKIFRPAYLRFLKELKQPK